MTPDVANRTLGDLILSATAPPTKTANTPTRGSIPVMNPAWDRDIPRFSL